LYTKDAKYARGKCARAPLTAPPAAGACCRRAGRSPLQTPPVDTLSPLPYNGRRVQSLWRRPPVETSRRPWVKICGNTSVEDALAAQEAGADFVGVVVDVPVSPRSVNAARAAQICKAVGLPVVMVVVNRPIDDLLQLIQAVDPSAVQLHGDEQPDAVASLRAEWSGEVWKALHIEPAGEAVPAAALREYEDAGVALFVVDSIIRSAKGTVYGGTGRAVDWAAASRVIAEARVPCLLAGGITPENVAEALRSASPAGVDVASGVERRPGVKDPERMRRLIAAARAVRLAGRCPRE
jgi:phosphoribosylanthranilate isomerase